jgi:hypothetical protein
MSLADYSHVLTIGSNCTVVRQLQFAAGQLGIDERRIMGPFDWFIVPLDAGRQMLRQNFRHFFSGEALTLQGTLPNYWDVTTSKGMRSMRHFHRNDTDVEISATSWFKFGRWLGRRVELYESALADPNGRVLVLRLEDAEKPDDPAALGKLAEMLLQGSRAQVQVLAISYASERPQCHPEVRNVVVECSWPAQLPVAQVDWYHDYGFGPAWHGHDESWREVWQKV